MLMEYVIADMMDHHEGNVVNGRGKRYLGRTDGDTIGYKTIHFQIMTFSDIQFQLYMEKND